MHLMTLVYQTLKRASHRDNIIIGMRAENDDSFRIGFCPLGTISIIRIGLSSRPSGNCVLQVIKYLDIHIIGRSVKSDQLTQSVVIIILICQLENRFIHHSTKPNYGPTDEFAGPFTVCNQPGATNTCKLRCCRQVHIHFCFGMCLQDRARNQVGYRSLDNIGDTSCLLFTPGNQSYFFCIHHIRKSHCDCTHRYLIEWSKVTGNIFTRIPIEHDKPCLWVKAATWHIKAYISLTTQSQ